MQQKETSLHTMKNLQYIHVVQSVCCSRDCTRTLFLQQKHTDNPEQYNSVPMLGFLENQSKFTHVLSNMESPTPETVKLVFLASANYFMQRTNKIFGKLYTMHWT